MRVAIKNMVCTRCINWVQRVLADFQGIKVLNIGLGYAEIDRQISNEDKISLGVALKNEGFELLDDEKGQRVEQIKNLVISEIHHSANQKGESENFSTFLSREIGMDYSYLNDLFSSLEGQTIGQFITLQKIERAKELLVYDQLSLAEIADELEYNSGQYLSAQFKKVTGMTPSVFKKMGIRKAIDHI